MWICLYTKHLQGHHHQHVLSHPDLPVALLPVLPLDVAAVDNGGEVVGAALLPLPDTLGLLGLALTALDVDTSLVTHHQLGRV